MSEVLFEFTGNYKDAAVINLKIAEITGDFEHLFFENRENDLSFLAFLEWKDGKTYVIKPKNNVCGAVTKYWEDKLAI